MKTVVFFSYGYLYHPLEMIMNNHYPFQRRCFPKSSTNQVFFLDTNLGTDDPFSNHPSLWCCYTHIDASSSSYATYYDTPYTPESRYYSYNQYDARRPLASQGPESVNLLTVIPVYRSYNNNFFLQP